MCLRAGAQEFSDGVYAVQGLGIWFLGESAKYPLPFLSVDYRTKGVVPETQPSWDLSLKKGRLQGLRSQGNTQRSPGGQPME